MLEYPSEPRPEKTLPGEQPDKDNQPDKGSRRKEGDPAERDFIAQEQPERNEIQGEISKTSTSRQQNENVQNSKKEGNPAEKDFTPEESNEEEIAEKSQL